MQLGNIVHLKKNGTAGSKFPLLEGNECIIGSGFNCQVRINSLGPSELHVCVIKTGKNGKACIQKLSKTLPIILNGDEVKGTKTLNTGDIINLIGRKFQWETTLVTKTPGRVLKRTGISKQSRRKSLSDFRASVRKSMKHSIAGHLSTWEETNEEDFSNKVSSPNKSSIATKVVVAASTSSALKSNIQVTESPLKLTDPNTSPELVNEQFGFKTKIKSARKSVKKMKAVTPKAAKTTVVRSVSARKSGVTPIKISQRSASADKKSMIPQKKYFETNEKIQRPNKKYFGTPLKFSPVHKTRKNSPLIAKSIQQIEKLISVSPVKKIHTPLKTKNTPVKGKTPLKLSPRSAKKTPIKSVLTENTPSKLLTKSAKKTPAKSNVLTENKVRNSPIASKSAKKTPVKNVLSPIKSATKTRKALNVSVKTPQSVNKKQKLPAVKENITPPDSLANTPENGVKTPDNFILKPLDTPQSIKAVKSAVKKDASLRKSLSKQNYSNKRKLSDITSEMGISKKIKLSTPAKEVIIDDDVEFTPEYSSVNKYSSTKSLTEPRRTNKRSKRNSLPSSVDKFVAKGRTSMSNRSTPRNVWSKQRVSTDTPTLHLEESLGNCSPVSRTHQDEIAQNISFTSINESFNTHKDLSGIERISNDSDLNLIDVSSPKKSELLNVSTRSQKLNATFSPGPSKLIKSAKKSMSLIDFSSPIPSKDTRRSRSTQKNISIVNAQIHTPEPLRALNITSKSQISALKTPVQTRTILSDKYENITPEPENNTRSSRKSMQKNDLQCEVNLENISMFVHIDENSPMKTFNSSKVSKRVSGRLNIDDLSQNETSEAEIYSPGTKNTSRLSKRYSKFNSTANNKSLDNFQNITSDSEFDTSNISKNNVSRLKSYTDKQNTSKISLHNNTIENIMSPNISANNISRASKRNSKKLCNSIQNNTLGSPRDVFSDTEIQNNSTIASRSSKRLSRKSNVSRNSSLRNRSMEIPEDILSDSEIYVQNDSKNNVSRSKRFSQELNFSTQNKKIESPIMIPDNYNIAQNKSLNNVSTSSRKFSQKLNLSAQNMNIESPIVSSENSAQNTSKNNLSRSSKRFSNRFNISSSNDNVGSPNISSNSGNISKNNVSRSSNRHSLNLNNSPNISLEEDVGSPNISSNSGNISKKNVSRSSNRYSRNLNNSPNISIEVIQDTPAPSKITKNYNKSLSLIDLSSPVPTKAIRLSRSSSKLNNTTFDKSPDDSIIPETPGHTLRNSTRLSRNQSINSTINNEGNLDSSFESSPNISKRSQRSNTSSNRSSLVQINNSTRSVKTPQKLNESKNIQGINNSSQDILTSSSEMSSLNVSQRSLRKSVLKNATFNKSLAETTLDALNNSLDLIGQNTSNISVNSSRRTTQNATFRKSMDDCRVDIVNISVDHITLDTSQDGNTSRRTTRSLKIDTSLENSDLDNTKSMSLHYDSTNLNESIGKKMKSPLNDLSKIAGVKSLFKTPKQLKSPLNDLTDVKGVKNLYKTPGRAAKSPKNDLTEIKGVKKMFKTPKRQRSPENNLDDVKGIKKLMKTPKQRNSPRNDLSDLRGVKQLIEGYEKSPRNDLTNIAGVKKFLRTPKIVLSPKNDLSNIKGVQKLFSTTTAKSPKNDLTDVGGVKRMFGEASTSNSYLNVSSMDVLFDELKDNENNSADDSFKIVEKLKHSPVRTYERKAKSVSPQKREKTTKTRASVYNSDKEPADIAKWIEEQKSFTKNKDDSASKEIVNEVKRKSTRVSGDHLLDDKIPPTNDPELLFVSDRPTKTKRELNSATEDENETPTRRESRRKQKMIKEEPQTLSNSVKPKYEEIVEDDLQTEEMIVKETQTTNKRTRNHKVNEPIVTDSPTRTRRVKKEIEVLRNEEVVASPSRTRRGKQIVKPEEPIKTSSPVSKTRRGRQNAVEIVESVTVKKTTKRIRGAKNTVYTETIEVLEDISTELSPKFNDSIIENKINQNDLNITDDELIDNQKNKKHVTFVTVAEMDTPAKMPTRGRRGAKIQEMPKKELETRKVRSKKTKVEAEDQEETLQVVAKKRPTRGKKIVQETNIIENEDVDVIVPAKRGRQVKAKKIVEEIKLNEKENIETNAPVKKGRSTRGKKMSEEEKENEIKEDKEQVIVKKGRATRGRQIKEQEEEIIITVEKKVKSTRSKKDNVDEIDIEAEPETKTKIVRSRRGNNEVEKELKETTKKTKTTRTKKLTTDVNDPAEKTEEVEEKPKSTRGKRTKMEENSENSKSKTTKKEVKTERKTTKRTRKAEPEENDNYKSASLKRQKVEENVEEKPKGRGRAKKAEIKEEEPIRKSTRTRKAK